VYRLRRVEPPCRGIPRTGWAGLELPQPQQSLVRHKPAGQDPPYALVLVGAEDSATPPEKAAALQRGIAGARMIVVPAAGHTSTLENPGFVTAAIAEFLEACERSTSPRVTPA
jgi:pimeloyl-ACP methyl ester carboxylesterase